MGVTPVTFRRGRHRFLSGAVAAALVLVAGCSPTPAVAAERTQIHVLVGETLNRIEPLLFGANNHYGMADVGGADPVTGRAYPKLVDQMRAVGLSMVRYPGGLMANTFRFDTAIGPQSGRPRQLNGWLTGPPVPAEFGPDEFGDMLDRTGAAGDLMLNFATRNAADAANFVAYMTAEQGSSAWAARRAANGHPAPYRIAFAEVANEFWRPAQNYWITGALVSVRQPCSGPKLACLYAFGGTTEFTGQPLGKPDSYADAAGTSDGGPGQVFRVRYAPVDAASAAVSVDGTRWKRVDDLGGAGADPVYTLDPATGDVRFGDGTHGAVPPKGARLTADYRSGPHDGFVDFYAAIKAVAPQLPVCATLDDPDFVAIMGNRADDDCIASHPYVDGPEAPNLNDYAAQLVQETETARQRVAALETDIAAHTAGRSRPLRVLLSEYGILRTPSDQPPAVGRSLASAVAGAQMLRNWMLDGDLLGANRHVLTEYSFAEPPIHITPTDPQLVLFGGPGPDTVPQPNALVIQQLARLSGHTAVRTVETGNPVWTLSDQSTIDALSTVAAVDDQGRTVLAVINRDPVDAVPATVDLGRAHDPRPEVDTLGAPRLDDSNSPAAPATVAIRTDHPSVGSGAFDWTFPPHSVTTITA